MAGETIVLISKYDDYLSNAQQELTKEGYIFFGVKVNGSDSLGVVLQQVLSFQPHLVVTEILSGAIQDSFDQNSLDPIREFVLSGVPLVVIGFFKHQEEAIREVGAEPLNVITGRTSLLMKVKKVLRKQVN